MQRKITALIVACSMTFATLPLCVNANNHNIDFSVEDSAEYILNSVDFSTVEEEENDALLLSQSEGSLLGAFFEGEGTKENPYILSTTQHFSILAGLVNSGNTAYNSAYYKLGNSIDFKNVSKFIPIGRMKTEFGYPGDGDFAPYKKGTYKVSAELSALLDTEYGQIDVGTALFSSSLVEIDKNGKAILKLNFKTADISLSEDVSAKFFVSDYYGVDGVQTAGSLGYKKNDGTWIYKGSDLSITKSGSSFTVVPSYPLSEEVTGITYVKQMSFPLDVKTNSYSLALTVDSDVLGAELGGETEYPVTLNIDWSSFSAPIYSESEYEEKIVAEYPFSGHLDGNGYTLKNLTINSSERLIGIFGYGYNASVENLRVENLNINAERDYTMYIGGLFGLYKGNWRKEDLHITGCHIDGKIVANCNRNAYPGGLIGVHEVNLNAALVKDCRVDIDITSVSRTSSYVGGLIATIETGIDLSKCVVTGYAYGETTGDANQYTGGISARLVYNDWIGTTASSEDAVLMASEGYTTASKLVSSIELHSVGLYNPYIGNTFSKVLDTNQPTECYYDSQYAVTGTLGSYTGTGKTEAELFDKSFLSGTIGLDFENTWIMVLGKPDLISKDPYIAFEPDGASFNVQPVGCGDCKVIASAYDSNGRVVASRIASYTEGTPSTISFDGVEYEQVKIFAFDNSYSPLCEAASYTIQ